MTHLKPMTTEAAVRYILEEHFCVDEKNIFGGAKLNEDLGLDSLDHAEFIMLMESEFNLEIADAKADNIETVQQAIAYVESHKSR